MANTTELIAEHVPLLRPWLDYLDTEAARYHGQVVQMQVHPEAAVILEEEGRAGVAPEGETSPWEAQDVGSDPISWLTDAEPVEVDPGTIAPEEGATPSGESTPLQPASVPVTNPDVGDDPTRTLL